MPSFYKPLTNVKKVVQFAQKVYDRLAHISDKGRAALESIFKMLQVKVNFKTDDKEPKGPTPKSLENILLGLVKFYEDLDAKTLRTLSNTIDQGASQATKLDKRLEKTIKASSEAMRILAEDLRAGLISIPAFEQGMRREVRKVALAGLVYGKNGAMLTSDQDVARLTDNILNQFSYLNRFIADLKTRANRAGFVTKSDIHRASQYANFAWSAAMESRRIVMEETFAQRVYEVRILAPGDSCEGCIAQAELGPQPIGTLAPIGSQECGHKCRCKFAYVDVQDLDGEEGDHRGPVEF